MFQGQAKLLYLTPLLMVVAGFASPYFASSYILYFSSILIVFFVLALGFDILSGRAGQFAFSHSAFYGIGAYGTALLQIKFGVPFLGGLILSASLSALVGLIMAIPALRMRQIYLTLATFSFAQATYFLMQSWVNVTGGADGLQIPAPTIFGLKIVSDENSFPAMMTLTALVLSLTILLSRSRLGLAFQAIKESEHAAAVSGINVRKTKIAAFVISSVYASVGGSLLTLFNSYIYPENFALSQMILLLTMVAVGGMGSIAGCALGVVMIGLLPELLRTTMASALVWQEFIYGAILIATMMFLPRGIWGTIQEAIHEKREI